MFSKALLNLIITLALQRILRLDLKIITLAATPQLKGEFLGSWCIVRAMKVKILPVREKRDLRNMEKLGKN